MTRPGLGDLTGRGACNLGDTLDCGEMMSAHHPCEYLSTGLSTVQPKPVALHTFLRNPPSTRMRARQVGTGNGGVPADLLTPRGPHQ